MFFLQKVGLCRLHRLERPNELHPALKLVLDELLTEKKSENADMTAD